MRFLGGKINHMKLTQFATICALATTTSLVQANPVVWQDFSLTALYGENYELGTEDRTTITAEYVAKLKYSDVFFFVDHQIDGHGDQNTYLELSPRLSLGEVSGKKLALGPVKDVLIATTWEHNAGYSRHNAESNNFMYGVGFDLAVPYTQYASVNFYKVENDKIDDDYQMTITYAVPFKLGSEEYLVDAFLDWSTAEDDHASELNWTSQYKWNVGKHISPKTKLYLGIEHSVWNNKFGVKGFDQNDVSALVKYHF